MPRVEGKFHRLVFVEEYRPTLGSESALPPAWRDRNLDKQQGAP